jgi:hypothetical protein
MALGHFLSGAASGVNLGVAAGDKIGGAILKRSAIEEQERKADAQLRQAAALGAWDRAYKVLENPDFPSSTKISIYNGAGRAALRSLGYDMPELPADAEWGPDFTKYARGFNAILSDPTATFEEKRAWAAPLFAQMAADPRLAPVIKDYRDQLAAQRLREVDTIANVYGRILADDPTLTDDEKGLFYAQRAIAQAPDRPEDEPWIRQARQERGLVVAEGMNKAHAQRAAQREAASKGVVKLGATERAVEIDPVTGAAREVVGAAPTGPALSQAVKDIIQGEFGVRVEQLDPSRPADAAIIKRARTLAREEDVSRAAATGREAARIQTEAKMGAPIADDAVKYVHRRTLEPPAPNMAMGDVVKSRDYLAVSPSQAQRLPQFFSTTAGLDMAGEIIAGRPDLFPPSTGNRATDTAAVAAARVKYQALRVSGTDPDIAQLETLKGQLPQTVRLFGDSGNIAVAERTMAQEFFGVGPATRETVEAKLRTVRKLVNESFSLAKEYERPTATPAAAGPTKNDPLGIRR